MSSPTEVPRSKRKVSNSSPNLVSSNKKILLSDSGKKMSGDSKEITSKLDNFQVVLDKILLECKENKENMVAIDKDNKARIAENSKQIEVIRQDQQLIKVSSDKRISGLEDKVDHLTSLVEKGTTQTHAHAFNYEAEHEKELRAQITESKSCVTALGQLGKEETTRSMASKLTQAGYHLNGKAEKIILSVSKLSPSAVNPSWRIQLDSATTAESLLEQSRAMSKDSKDKDNKVEIRLVKYYPPAYARAARDYRQMASMIYENGGLAKLEYEGTTLTLRGKSKETGGEWVILRNCEFKPMAVGRMTPQENENPCFAKARSLMDKVLDNSANSLLARSLYLHTETSLGVFEDAKNLLGAVLADGLTEVKSVKSNRSKFQYTLAYSTRAKALQALAKYNTSQAVIGVDRGTSWLTVCLPVVADEATSS